MNLMQCEHNGHIPQRWYCRRLARLRVPFRSVLFTVFRSVSYMVHYVCSPAQGGECTVYLFTSKLADVSEGQRVQGHFSPQKLSFTVNWAGNTEW